MAALPLRARRGRDPRATGLEHGRLRAPRGRLGHDRVRHQLGADPRRDLRLGPMALRRPVVGRMVSGGTGRLWYRPRAWPTDRAAPDPARRAGATGALGSRSRIPRRHPAAAARGAIGSRGVCLRDDPLSLPAVRGGAGGCGGALRPRCGLPRREFRRAATAAAAGGGSGRRSVEPGGPPGLSSTIRGSGRRRRRFPSPYL